MGHPTAPQRSRRFGSLRSGSARPTGFPGREVKLGVRPLIAALASGVIGGFALFGCGGGGGGGEESTGMIGEEGGVVSSIDGKLKLEIPPGALKTPQQIFIETRPAKEFSEEFLSSFEVQNKYLLQPEGLRFDQPVTATLQVDGGTKVFNTGRGEDTDGDGKIDVSSPTKILSDFRFLTLQSEGDQISLPQDQKLLVAADQATVFLQGKIVHFSEIFDVRPINASITVDFTGVPDQIPMGSGFSSTVTVAQSSDSNFEAGQVFLSSNPGAPVSATGSLGGGRKLLGSLSPGNPNLSSRDRYVCRSEGKGTYQATVTFEQTNLTPLFQPFLNGAQVAGEGEPLSLTFSTDLSKTVNCGGVSDPSPSPSPRPSREPEEEPSPDPSVSPSPSVSPHPSPSASPSPSPSASPSPSPMPGASASPDLITATHFAFEDPCPQTIGTVLITNIGAARGIFDIIPSTADIVADTAAIQLDPGQSGAVQLSFTCVQFDNDVNATVSFVARGGGNPPSDSVQVVVDIIGGGAQ